jgi:hypothetical protein
VVLAVTCILRPVILQPKTGATAIMQLRRRRERREGEHGMATGVSEARSRQCRGNNTPTLMTPPQGKDHEVTHCTSIRRSDPAGRRETSGSPVTPYGAQDSVGHPRCESGESEPGTHEVRVHVDRLGGRNRLDASRVFLAGRSQGLLGKKGASQEEVRSTA